MNNSKNKLKLNTLTSFILQITNIINGFILPRLILGAFGSDVNGLVNSITQFLSIVSLLDLGVGAVIQSSLYKPLADNDINTISKIYVSAKKFFHKVATVLLIYITILTIVYPLIVNHNSDKLYIAILILIIGISNFAQYYFGIVNSLLLSADQKGYIQYSIKIITLVINTIACAIMIKMGGSIQMVKLTTSLIFLIRPLYLAFYVKKHYDIDQFVTYTEEPIKQKWNGMAQHFAAYIIGGTDNIVLTLFSTLANVSIYSVYNIVISGIKNSLLSMTNGIQSLIGELLAKRELEKLNKVFAWVEWSIHTCTTLVFGCTSILIVSFVQVYTKGINDADYYQPLFAMLITLANAGHCLRLPYNILILAAGHYKQTQTNYVVATILNIVISISTVKILGLIGVAIGTLISMMYQTIWMAHYNSKNIINWNFKFFLKQIVVDGITILISTLITINLSMASVTYLSWLLFAVRVLFCFIIVVFVVNYIFYRDKITYIINMIGNKLKLNKS